jgi:transposase-like protein
MTYTEFMRRFPDNDACLEDLKRRHYPNGTQCPKCGRPSRFHRIKGRSAYSCQFCAHHVYPTAGTIFHKSSTSLQLWFWAIYLVSSSKCGISAKQLGREVGVTYKTAHRMLKQIRTLLAEDIGPLSGEVELDETFVGGKPRASHTRGMTRSELARHALAKKTIVFAAAERNGRVRASVVPQRDKANLIAKSREFVLPESMIFTDEWPPYEQVAPFFKGHRRVKHKQRITSRTTRGPRTWNRSSRSSRTAFGERITTCPPSTSRTTWTSTRFAGIGGRRRGLSSGRFSSGLRRLV